jgi:hypothetical protein
MKHFSKCLVSTFHEATKIKASDTKSTKGEIIQNIKLGK